MLERYWRPTWAVFLPSLRSPVSSMTRAPLSLGALAGSSSRSSTLRRFISSGSHLDSERNHCRLWASLRCAPTGFGVGQGGQSLVALGRQQQTLQVTAESLTLGAGTKEVVEALGIVLKWSGSGAYRRAFGHGEAPPPPLEHGS